MADFLAETKLFRVGLYFTSLAICLVYVLWKAFVVSKASTKLSKWLFILPVMAAVSLVVTCRDIAMFIVELSNDYPDMKTTLKESEIMVEVYRVVTNSIEGYWWSSQLLLFTLVFIVFLNTKARQISMTTMELCAYTWLGFGGAISIAFALFVYRYNVAISMETRRVEHHQMSTWSLAVLAVCLWFSFICIMFLYFSVGVSFKIYLLLSHIILFLPSLLPSVHVRSYTTTTAKGLIPFLYAVLSIAITGHHFYFTHFAFPNSETQTFHNLFHAGFAHYSQSAISSNAVLSFIICIIYLCFRSDEGMFNIVVVVPFIALSPCISLGSAFAFVMLYEEYKLERKTEIKED